VNHNIELHTAHVCILPVSEIVICHIFCNGYFKDSTFFSKNTWQVQDGTPKIAKLPYKWLNYGFGTVDITIVNGC